jgi:hypothetical protein
MERSLPVGEDMTVMSLVISDMSVVSGDDGGHSSEAEPPE